MSVESDIRHVVNELILNVERKEVEHVKVGVAWRGTEKRRGYGFSFKMNIIEQLDSGICAADVAFEIALTNR